MKNGKTKVATLERQVSPLTPREAFVAVYPHLRAAARFALAPSLFVAAVDPDGEIVTSATIVDGQALTIGRHERCAFRLDAEDVSLRHLVAHARLTAASPTAPGSAVTRLWDLNTSRPFLTEDGVAASAVVAEGPLFVTLGVTALLLVPLRALRDWPEHAEAAWDALPVRQFLDCREPRARDPRPGSARSAPSARSDGSHSIITRVQPPSFVDAVPRGAGAWAELGIDGGGRPHRLSAEQLTEGILVGRYQRCQLAPSEDESVSRVHLLVVRVDDRVYAIDTASTNGTQREGRDVDAVPLRDRDSLHLATDTVLTWRRLAVAMA